MQLKKIKKKKLDEELKDYKNEKCESIEDKSIRNGFNWILLNDKLDSAQNNGIRNNLSSD